MDGVVKIFTDRSTVKPVALPELPLLDVSIVGARLVNKIYWVDEGAVFTVHAVIQNRIENGDEPALEIPFGDTSLSTPVEEIVDGKAVKTLRFESQITTDAEGVVKMQLPMKLPSGNYLISPERINRGLAEIGAPFRFKFDAVDIDSMVVVA
jgi:hypothetical protein